MNQSNSASSPAPATSPLPVPRRRRVRKPIVVLPPPPRNRISDRGERLLIVAAYFDGRKTPMIRMRGEWLQKRGFTPGAHFIVTEEPGRLVFTREPRRVLTVSREFDVSGEELPMIRLTADWLQKLGFKVGARIAVSEEQDRIVLTVAD
jgi:hypothetical protein